MALRFYLGEERSGWRGLWWGGVAASLALYCRQHYLFLTAGMGLSWLLARARERRLTPGDVRDLALIAMPALLFLPLFVTWGGLTPPDFQQLHPLRLTAQHINFLLVFVGLYFAPLAVVAWPAVIRWGRRAAWLILGLPVYAAFRPRYEMVVQAADSSEQGIIQHGLQILQGTAGPLLPALGQLALWANGLVIGAMLLRRQPGEQPHRSVTLWCMVAAFAGILLVSDFVDERFYALIVPVLMLLLYPRVAGRRAIIGLWVAGMIVLAAAYSITKMQGG